MLTKKEEKNCNLKIYNKYLHKSKYHKENSQVYNFDV